MTTGPLDFSSTEVEELSLKTHIFFQKWPTASATVTPWATHSSVSWGYWEQLPEILGQYLEAHGGLVCGLCLLSHSVCFFNCGM